MGLMPSTRIPAPPVHVLWSRGDGVRYDIKNSSDEVFLKSTQQELETVIAEQRKTKADCKIAYMKIIVNEDWNIAS